MALEELLVDAARVLRETEPSACLVLPRVLRRVIKEHGEFSGLALHVPHRKCYLIDVERLLWYVSPDELHPSSPPTDRALLIAHPDEQELEGMARPQLLRELWRTLFHARVHTELDSDVAVGRLSPEVIHQRIDHIGQAEFDEAVAVLKYENFLLTPENLTSCYIEFIAVWTELGFFDPAWREAYFPAIHDAARVDALIAEDFDARALFDQTRLPGAALPGEPSAVVLEPVVRSLLSIAEESGKNGNAVRAALLRSHVGTIAPPGYVEESFRRANEELDRLCERLHVALRFPESERSAWRAALSELLTNSRRGFWDADKRLLYDLQNACVDHERELSVLDPLPWLFTRGRRPLKRPLPHLRDVLIARHLRRAQRRLSSSQLDDAGRARLKNLLWTSAEAAEDRMRHQFRPILQQAILDAGLRPTNLPEQVALGKVVEELLDTIVERGFLTIGILRDALSRNNLKLPDFPAPLPAGPAETPAPSRFQRTLRLAGCAVLALFGMPQSTDPLLQIDQRLSQVLDGVYRRGDFYLRMLQGVSALAFGTPVGRFLTKYVVLPIGGSYVILMGVQHLAHLVQDFVSPPAVVAHAPAEPASVAAPVEPAKPASEPAHAPATGTHDGHHGDSLPNLYAWAGLSLFLFGMLHIPPFRTLIVKHVLLAVFHVLKGLVYDIPRWLLRLPWVHRIVYSRTLALVRRFIVTPLACTTFLWVLFPAFRRPYPDQWWFAVLFVLFAAALNSRLGRNVEEVSADALGRLWYHIRSRIFVALYELVMDTFKQLLESAERVLYAVDEWLRFRSGESSGALAVKATLGVLWSAVNYVLRFLINLIVEPQVNPIKHFPVVTVSHKMILPTQPYLARLLYPAMGTVYGNAVAVAIVTVIPGIFGFLVWELKENWRLFTANRRRHLAPVMIGHHGESLIRLMKPGLHSGTLPKLFARIRRAQRKSYLARSRKALTRYEESLHHLEIALRHFFERELVALLDDSPSWDAPAVQVGHLHLASNSVRVELCCPELGSKSVWLTFEEQCGWLLANVSERGWIDQLSPAALVTLETALLGTFKLGGVDLIREEITARFAPFSYPYDIREEQLVLWPDPSFRVEVRYSFDERPSRPRPRSVARDFPLPEIDPHRLLFSHRAIAWANWVGAWKHAAPGEGPRESLLDQPHVLTPDPNTPRLRIHAPQPEPQSAAGSS